MSPSLISLFHQCNLCEIVLLVDLGSTVPVGSSFHRNVSSVLWAIFTGIYHYFSLCKQRMSSYASQQMPKGYRNGRKHRQGEQAFSAKLSHISRTACLTKLIEAV